MSVGSSTDLVPPGEPRVLVALSEARRVITLALEAGDADALLEYRDKAAAAQHFLRVRQDGKAGADDCGEIKVRAEAALGQLDAEERPPHSGVASPGEATPPLPVAAATRAAWRKLGQLEGLDELIERMRADEASGVTTATALKLATGPTAGQLIVASDENEWYTPTRYLDAARGVLGAVDLDPASNDRANQQVRASRHYTIDDDGLEQPWGGRVWLNPPYGRLAGAFVARLVESYRAGDVTAAVCLVNAHCTDTRWFQALWNHILCFTDHRLDFDAGDRVKTTTSTHGSVFVYLGPDEQLFAEAFAEFGAIVRRWAA